MAWFEPYERDIATRWLRIALAAFAAIPLLSAPWTHAPVAVVAVPVLGCLLCAGAAAAMVRRWRPGSGAWACCLVASVVFIVAADLTTRDASATGLITFSAPVVLAAALLRRAGAWVTTALSSTGSLIVCFVVLAPAAATTTSLTVTSMLALLTALLAHAAHRNHHLTAELHQLAAVDSLTGLVTRRVLDGALAAALCGSAASRGNGLLIVDLDRFKSINDTRGHLVGDEALRHTGSILTSLAGPTAVVSRIGGDELAVLLPGGSREETAALAQAVVDAVRRSPLRLDGHHDDGTPDAEGETTWVFLTVSVGAAHNPTHAADSRALYRAADEALYTAKSGGRDRHHIAAGTGPGTSTPTSAAGGRSSPGRALTAPSRR